MESKMKPEQINEIEIWRQNHTWYDLFEMGAIDLLLEEMDGEYPDAQIIINKILTNLES